jgi:excisionase family DNA binding protein
VIDLTREKKLSLSAAAKLVGVCKHTIRAMIDRGELDGVWFGGRLYTTTEALGRAQREPVTPGRTAPEPPRSPVRKARGAQRAAQFLDSEGL